MITPRKITSWLGRFLERLPKDMRVQVIREELARTARTPAGDAPRRYVALQSREDPFYLGVFTALARSLQTQGLTCELVVVCSVSGVIGNNWRARLYRSNLLGMLNLGKWVRAFGGTVDRVAYRSLSLSHPLGDLLDWFRSRRVWREIRSSSDISDLRILGLPVGDLIIDSFLRFRPAPRFDAADPFVARLIWQVYRDIRRARRYFHTRKPELYLTSYSTYVEHGIPVRVALEAGVPVRAFGSLVQVGKPLTAQDWFHTPDCSQYRTTFESLDAQEGRLQAAEQQLRARLSGGIDLATSYMRVSAYAGSAEPLPDVAGAVVVFLHDFYDSPHVYGDLIFPDFWAWITFTIDTLRAAGIRFFLKPHPNQISLSNEALDSLRAAYPGLSMLSARNTNSQLAAAGMLCGVTMYGTVAHELAFLGIPTIACARHPHHAFDFCRTAHTVEEYRQFLQQPARMPLSRELMRRQALAFYYMHNLHGSAETLQLRQQFVAFFKACNDSNTTPAQFAQAFNDLRTSAALQSQVAKMTPGSPGAPIARPVSVTRKDGAEQLS